MQEGGIKFGDIYNIYNQNFIWFSVLSRKLLDLAIRPLPGSGAHWMPKRTDGRILEVIEQVVQELLNLLANKCLYFVESGLRLVFVVTDPLVERW